MCNVHSKSCVLKLLYKICPFPIFSHNPVWECGDMESYISDPSLSIKQISLVVNITIVMGNVKIF